MAKKAKRAKPPARKKTASTNPVPAGLRTVTPYLCIKGAGAAIDWYKRALGAKEMSRQPGPGGTLMHAQIKIGDSVLMMSDEFPGSDTKSPDSAGGTTFNLHIYTKNADKLWNQAVNAGATPTMPLENQFWGERYGKFRDPYGHVWSLSQPIKMSKQEMEEKRQAAMAQFEKGGFEQGSP